MRSAVVMFGVLGATSLVSAAPAHPPARDLMLIPQALTIPGADLHWFRMIAPTAMLTGELDRDVATDAHALGALATFRDGAPRTGKVDCTVGFATTTFVSWVCRGRWSDGGTSSETAEASAYFVDGNKLRPATFETIFAVTDELPAKLEAATGALADGTACHPLAHPAGLFVAPTGIELLGDDHAGGCIVAWAELAPLLAANSPLPALAARGADPRPRDPSSAWSPAASARFVQSGGETVRDQLTGLTWATRDSGADLTWAAAAAWAHAFHGGGHTDWRLPTEEELEVLAEPVLAHREPTDCTHGKALVMLTPVLHLSCGLAWSSTTVGDDRAVAYEFVAGGARVVDKAQKKGARALVVRAGH